MISSDWSIRFEAKADCFEMATYGYLNAVANFDSPASKICLDTTEQRVAITKRLSTGVNFIFTEDDGCKSSAFQVLLNTLKKGDVVVVWDWRCFVNPNNLPKASADVWDKILKIHQNAASVHFVNGDYDTKTAKGRYLLTLSIAGAQFEHDRHLEEANGSTASVMACCSKSASTGC